MLCSCLHALYCHSEVFFIHLSNWKSSSILQSSVQVSGPLKKNPLLSYLNKLHYSSYFIHFYIIFFQGTGTHLHTFCYKSKKYILGISLEIQKLVLCAFTAGDPDPISGQGNQILQAACVIFNTNGIAFITLFFISYFMKTIKMVITQ